jgi:hypothetical protein
MIMAFDESGILNSASGHQYAWVFVIDYSLYGKLPWVACSFPHFFSDVIQSLHE